MDSISPLNTASPCKNICTTKNGICQGCGRTVQHVTFWTSMTPQEKHKANEEAKTRLIQMIKDNK